MDVLRRVSKILHLILLPAIFSMLPGMHLKLCLLGEGFRGEQVGRVQGFEVVSLNSGQLPQNRHESCSFKRLVCVGQGVYTESAYIAPDEQPVSPLFAKAAAASFYADISLKRSQTSGPPFDEVVSSSHLSALRTIVLLI